VGKNRQDRFFHLKKPGICVSLMHAKILDELIAVMGQMAAVIPSVAKNPGSVGQMFWLSAQHDYRSEQCDRA
jgi:hypothetical protein